jgi:hypothetical protein
LPKKNLLIKRETSTHGSGDLLLRILKANFCDGASRYYGGPFFDSKGKILEKVKRPR